MNLIRYAVDHPVTVRVGVLLIVLFGMLSLGVIPVQLTPNVQTTVVSVATKWEGASPQEVENDIVRRQEEKLKGVANLEKLTSTCVLGEGTLTLEFHLGTSKEVALREVSNKLREVASYPQNVDEPVVSVSNPQNRDYIAWVVISSTDPSFDIRKLEDFCLDRVKPELERAEGISEVNVIGGMEREMQVLIDPVRLAQHRLTAGALVNKLRARNVSISAGQISEGKRDIRLRSVGRYERPQQIENTLLSEPGMPVVLVKDVAEVRLTYKEPTRIVRSRGRPVLAINAQREVGSNVIAVMNRYQQKLTFAAEHLLPAEAKRLGLEGTFELDQVYDQTIYIHQAVDLVLKNIWVGGSLAVVVLIIFLRSLRSTLIIAVAIPVCVIGTFLAMVVMGRSLNVISLAGLAFAVGMVVDNAIVVLENIDRHRKMGDTARAAALRAAREVWGAILISTLTTLAVFVPILTIQEEAGQLFRDISLAICAAVSLSLLVSITVIPSAASKLLGAVRSKPQGPGVDRQSGREGPVVALIGGLVDRLNRSWLLRPLVVLGMTATAVAGSFALMPPASYLPAGNRNLVFAMMFEPPGYNLEQRSAIGHRIEAVLNPYWEAALGNVDRKDLAPVQSMNPHTHETRQTQVPPLDNFFFVAIPQMMFMGGTSIDPMNVEPVAALMNNVIRQQPGIRGFALQMPLFRTASRGTGSGIELELSGPDLDEVARVARILNGKLGARFGFFRVRPDPANFDLPGPEVRVEMNARAANDLGLSQQDINLNVEIFGDGAVIGDYLDGDDTIDLKVRAVGAESGDAAAMAQWPIATPMGRIVPLESVAHIRRSTSPQQINRVEQQRAVALQINLPDEFPLEKAMDDIRDDLASMREQGAMPPTVVANVAGSAAKLRQVKDSLLGKWTGWNISSLRSLVASRMFLALLVVYLLMAALFESWIYPFVIMFSVPLATIGGFLGLRLVNLFVPSQQLDILTMLGFVILIGVVVNNAILIVHQTLNHMRGADETGVEGSAAEKLPPREAIGAAVRSRVRPIFMSTFTSVGGMLPLVLFPGAGSELYRGLGSVVVGGLLLSTVFTLLLVPLVLGMVLDLRAMLGFDVDAGDEADAPANRAEAEPAAVREPTGATQA